MNDTRAGDVLPYHGLLGAREWRAAVEGESRRAGQRSTMPRRIILDRIAASSGPFSAEELVAAMEADGGMGSRATVYRCVEWLRARGYIARVHSETTVHAYTRQSPGHHHNVVCTGCGAVFALAGCGVENQLEPLLAKLDFEIHGHLLELYGLCGQCRDRTVPTSDRCRGF